MDMKPFPMIAKQRLEIESAPYIIDKLHHSHTSMREGRHSVNSTVPITGDPVSQLARTFGYKTKTKRLGL